MRCRNEAFVFKASPEDHVVIRVFDFDIGKQGEPPCSSTEPRTSASKSAHL